MRLAELRRRLANPSVVDDGQRQRLLDLARSVARVRALRDEYGRGMDVDLSPMAKQAIEAVGTAR